MELIHNAVGTEKIIEHVGTSIDRPDPSQRPLCCRLQNLMGCFGAGSERLYICRDVIVGNRRYKIQDLIQGLQASRGISGIPELLGRGASFPTVKVHKAQFFFFSHHGAAHWSDTGRRPRHVGEVCVNKVYQVADRVVHLTLSAIREVLSLVTWTLSLSVYQRSVSSKNLTGILHLQQSRTINFMTITSEQPPVSRKSICN